ncbi:hypothetical protein J514_2780 [Acinetobacter sp. 1396970]|nr:hypothetical protein J514_2780 [Acinetobacter sp. 1396970]
MDKLGVVHKFDETLYKDTLTKSIEYANSKGIKIKVTKVK